MRTHEPFTCPAAVALIPAGASESSPGPVSSGPHSCSPEQHLREGISLHAQDAPHMAGIPGGFHVMALIPALALGHAPPQMQQVLQDVLQFHCGVQEFMVEQGLVTRTRRAFDRALCALPITQHERIWQIYLVRPAFHDVPFSCTPSQPCLTTRYSCTI